MEHAVSAGGCIFWLRIWEYYVQILNIGNSSLRNRFLTIHTGFGTSVRLRRAMHYNTIYTRPFHGLIWMQSWDWCVQMFAPCVFVGLTWRFIRCLMCQLVRNFLAYQVALNIWQCICSESLHCSYNLLSVFITSLELNFAEQFVPLGPIEIFTSNAS